MPKLSQETLTILGASVALAALIFTGIAGLRTEMQTIRTEIRTEIRSVRTEIRDVRTEAQTNVEILRAEARADRKPCEPKRAQTVRRCAPSCVRIGKGSSDTSSG